MRSLLLLLALQAPPPTDTSFAGLVASLSESGGYFDTDNLISNESSYLHVLGALRAEGAVGGGYIGVGPDQNFSYIAAIRPRIAFVIDIRRDNLLEHLLFKAIFHEAANRIEYLSWLFGRPVPADSKRWNDRPLTELLSYIERTPPDSAGRSASRNRLALAIRGFGIPLSATDLATIQRFHDAFIASGLELRFSSFGRSPRPYYPTIRQLFLEKDRSGAEASYVAKEADFQFVRDLERKNLVVPLVGDLAGPSAIKAIGRYLKDRGLTVSVFYTSNVEFYLFQQGSFGQFVQNVAALPASRVSTIVRSYFGGGMGRPHPSAVPGYYSVQLVQSFEGFARSVARSGAAMSYWDLVTADPH